MGFVEGQRVLVRLSRKPTEGTVEKILPDGRLVVTVPRASPPHTLRRITRQPAFVEPVPEAG